MLYQQRDQAGACLRSRKMQCGVTQLIVAVIDGGAVLQQALHHSGVPIGRRHVQRRLTCRRLRVHCRWCECGLLRRPQTRTALGSVRGRRDRSTLGCGRVYAHRRGKQQFDDLLPPKLRSKMQRAPAEHRIRVVRRARRHRGQHARQGAHVAVDARGVQRAVHPRLRPLDDLRARPSSWSTCVLDGAAFKSLAARRQ